LPRNDDNITLPTGRRNFRKVNVPKTGTRLVEALGENDALFFINNLKNVKSIFLSVKSGRWSFS